MSEMPLFYKSIRPLNSETDRAHGIAIAEKPFGFAAEAHLLPAVVDEFAAAARHFPIVFAPAGKAHTAVFLCGLKPGRNLLVAADGRWDAPYVPAYLRRYPFILGERNGADPVVCIDASFEGFAEGRGDRLFADDGRPTDQLRGVIQLVNDFAAAAERTELLAARLVELDLLKGVTIDVEQGKAGRSASIHGLSIVDEEKLAALSDEAFLELRRAGLLAPIYAHLFSIGATNALAGRLGAAQAEARSAEEGEDRS